MDNCFLNIDNRRLITHQLCWNCVTGFLLWIKHRICLSQHFLHYMQYLVMADHGITRPDWIKVSSIPVTSFVQVNNICVRNYFQFNSVSTPKTENYFWVLSSWLQWEVRDNYNEYIMFPVTPMMTMKAERTKTMSIEKKSIKVLVKVKHYSRSENNRNEI